MKIQPLRPLVLPILLLVLIALIAVMLSSFKPIDEAIIRLVQATPRSWEPAVQLLTSFGDVPNLILIALVVSIWEMHRRNGVRALAMASSLIALPSFYVAKEIVRRARPVSDFIAHHQLHGYSFPSGHSTGTMAVYGMIALLAYSHLKGLARVLVVGLCVLIIMVVGFTRVYLGAHYPTDVIAGWLLGFVVISLLRSLSLYLARHRSKPNSVAVDDTTESSESLNN